MSTAWGEFVEVTATYLKAGESIDELDDDARLEVVTTPEGEGEAS